MELVGRLLLQSEIDQLNITAELPIHNMPAVKFMKGEYICQRCLMSTFYKTPCLTCESCYYCTHCITMGKVKICEKLYYQQPAKEQFAKDNVAFTWQGELTKQQLNASQSLIKSLANGVHEHLIWAVTGSGKTEIIFKVIYKVLKQGGRVAICSPRVDVILELAPRLRAAFSSSDSVVLYEKGEIYRYTPLVICTVHQLRRFYRAFDLLIIDEIDAFPYSIDQPLQQVAKRAVLKTGLLVYLTATPSLEVQRRVRQTTLTASILPARYHGHALPLPTSIWIGNWRKQLTKGYIPKRLLKLIWCKLLKKKRFLLFLPNIQLMEQLEKLLKKEFKETTYSLASVSSKDIERGEKVLAMRQETYDFLLTTTILERGVTFEAIEVIVLGAEDRIFTSESLVQIAGRAGRSYRCPTGEVNFLHYGLTKAIKQAIKEIEQMNELARQKGLLL